MSSAPISRHPRFSVRQALGDAPELRIRIRRLPREIASHPKGIFPDRDGLPLAFPSEIGRRGRTNQGALALGEPLHRVLERRVGSGQRRGAALDVLNEGAELGAAAERS